MRAKAMVLATLLACSSSTPRPRPTVIAPAAGSANLPPTTEKFRAAPLAAGNLDGSRDLVISLEELSPPWTLAEVDRGNGVTRLVVAIRDRHYAMEISRGSDDVVPDLLAHFQLVPGSPKELLLVFDENHDGGKTVRLVACGLGPSGTPSCTAPVELASGDLRDRDPYQFDAIATGGLELRPLGDQRPRAFEFEFP